MSDKPKSGDKPKVISDEAIDDAKREILFGPGYGRPPREHQFKKGVSGNPSGRPRAQDPGERSSHAIALREAERLVAVREGETVRKMTQIDAVHRAQYVSATKGSAYAQKHIIERYGRARQEHRLEIEAKNERWRKYIERQRDLIEHAVKQGVAPVHDLPHPDDVVIDPEQGVRFIGPWDEESAARLEETLAWRDVLLAQDAWDARHGHGEGDHCVTLAGVLAVTLNQEAPLRRRLSNVELVMRKSRLEVTTKRELRKLLFQGWKKIGVRWRPTRILPSIPEFMKIAVEVRAAYDSLQEAEAK